MGKKLIVILTIAALGIFTLAAVGCAAVTDQRAAVSGIVVADGLAQEGTQVKQGDILVKVKSIAGGSIAALQLQVRLARYWLNPVIRLRHSRL